MRMGVWEIMEIDRSIRNIKKLRQKSINLQLDRSLKKNDFYTDSENSELDNRNTNTEPCRDCPEGMEW